MTNYPQEIHEVSGDTELTYPQAVGNAVLEYRKNESFWRDISPDCQFNVVLISTDYFLYTGRLTYTFSVRRLV